MVIICYLTSLIKRTKEELELHLRYFIKKAFLVLFTLVVSTQAKAQFLKAKSIDASIGFGMSAPNDETVDVIGTGFYMQAEYVFEIVSWIDVRPYAGLILTKENDDDNEENYKATSNAFLFGGKTRIKAPIPWVAPYIEIGIGASIGSFKTVTPFVNIDKSGLLLHIPFTIGLELGRKHNFDIAFTYYYHNSVEQFSGAAAFGFSFPLDSK